jgi:cobalt-zinc-cadmium resistance protein CzcA
MGFSFSQPIELRMAELISGTRSDVAITLYGDDLGTLERLSGQIQAVARGVPGATDVRGEQLAGLPTLEVTVDRAAASRYGVSVRDALDAIEVIGGRGVGEVYEGERRIRLQVRLPQALRDDMDQVRMLPVSGPSNTLVPLGQIASIQVVDSPASVSREAVRRRTNVEVNVRGRDLAGFVREAQARVRAQVDLPPGYVLRWGGQFENLAAASERLAFAVPLALGLIFVLLYMAFGEMKTALLIYLNVPFAAVGGVLLLRARGMPFSISAAHRLHRPLRHRGAQRRGAAHDGEEAAGPGALGRGGGARGRREPTARRRDDRDRRGPRLLPDGAVVERGR